MTHISETYKTFEIQVDYTSYAQSPREYAEWNHLYVRLGSGHYDGNMHKDICDYEEITAEANKLEEIALILPVYCYQHGCISLSTTPFHCKWDSGRAGYILVTVDQLREEFVIDLSYNRDWMTEKLERFYKLCTFIFIKYNDHEICKYLQSPPNRLWKILRDEISDRMSKDVEIYGKYLNGEVFDINIVDPRGDIVENYLSCIYGAEYISKEIDAAKKEIDSYVSKGKFIDWNDPII